MLRIHHHSFEEESEDPEEPTNIIQRPKAHICRLMDVFLGHIELASQYWFRIRPYFLVIHRFATLGTDYRRFLLDRNMIPIPAVFYLGKNAPFSVNKDLNKEV